MKNFKIIIFAFVYLLMLAACGGDDDKGGGTPINPVNNEGKTYQQSATLDAQGTQQTVTLTNLKSKIDDVQNSSNWLTVLISTYSSGSPKIELRATENTSTQQRSVNVTITAVNGDKVILTVTQQGAEEQKTGIDDSHDITTDKPAYSRQQ